MKRFFTTIFAVLLLITVLPFSAFGEVQTEEGYDYTRFQGENITLNVYNWGLYISDGTDDSMNVIQEFEDLTGIQVVYNTYDTNENL
ncbi:MAG: spermidine/putrescine ABC transporter substrate-binding protein, partial [Oscillospiraceae bacterium]|nr:spermidine/putrescine ABC transporter substrate-binding protein [Oscillospiraceae bacterium]